MCVCVKHCWACDGYSVIPHRFHAYVRFGTVPFLLPPKLLNVCILNNDVTLNYRWINPTSTQMHTETDAHNDTPTHPHRDTPTQRHRRTPRQMPITTHPHTHTETHPHTHTPTYPHTHTDTPTKILRLLLLMLFTLYYLCGMSQRDIRVN